MFFGVLIRTEFVSSKGDGEVTLKIIIIDESFISFANSRYDYSIS